MTLLDSHRTDFERFGLMQGPVHVAQRLWLLTVDFESFTPSTVGRWLAAMRAWARLAADGGWPFSIFIAVEDVVRLRASGRGVYDELAAAARAMHEAGAVFYPHNHGVFDESTGELAGVRPEHVAGYGKRASLVYDVVHRHRRPLAEWLGRVLHHYDAFLADAGIPRPPRLAFRAGGWDHGDTPELARQFLHALEDNAFAFDSSASSGRFGTATWRVGAPFGANLFALSPSLVEVAPCWSLDCRAGLRPRTVRSLLAQPQLWLPRRRPGAFVTVLHFDHIFVRTASDDGGDDVAETIASFFRLLGSLRRALNLDAATFETLRIER